jgi:hypothetical protein
MSYAAELTITHPETEEELRVVFLYDVASPEPDVGIFFSYISDWSVDQIGESKDPLSCRAFEKLLALHGMQISIEDKLLDYHGDGEC